MLKPPVGYYVSVKKTKSAWMWHHCVHCGSRMQWEDSYQVVTPLSLAYPSQYDKDHRILRGFSLPSTQDICLNCAPRVLGPDPLHLKPEELQEMVLTFFDLPEPQVVQSETGTANVVSILKYLSLGDSKHTGGSFGESARVTKNR